MRVFVTVLLIIGLIGTCNVTFAQEQKAAKDTISENSLTASESMEINEYKGIVNKTDTGYSLMAGEKTYLLQGEGLEELVGKTVSISGKLLKGETNDTILVATAEPIES
ncbi:MAG: hypothetical protein KKE44_25150 [Proteobacteria bacterium]|nr:hypothetical protein [Pseudomonadota bacterium]MBU1586019.1 hypothetical protein [Pseudomonadota bacterium]MBU2628875.1 hypothetical protein [Pseudomonadota bacterium]